MGLQTFCIHNYDQMLERNFELLEESTLSDEDKRLLKEFVNWLLSTGIGKPRVVKYLSTLKVIGLALGKPFRQVSKKDLVDFFARMNSRADYSVWTKADYATLLKRFFKWLKPQPDDEYPEEVRWIKRTLRKRDIPKVNKAELITEEDVKRLVGAALQPRDKALIALTWDTGARIGEIGSMTVGSVSFEDNGTYVDLNGKTGRRTCIAIESTPHLLNWISLHPFRDDPNAPLWINIGQPKKHRYAHIDYRTLYKIFQNTFKKAGIQKRYNPHLFRHSRATWCAQNGWSTYQMCKHFGWELDSNMPSVYISLVDADVHDKMREAYGLPTKSIPLKESRQHKPCPRCNAQNNPTNQFCYKCGLPSDTKTAINIMQERKKDEQQLTTLLKNPLVIKAIKKALQETTQT